MLKAQKGLQKVTHQEKTILRVHSINLNSHIKDKEVTGLSSVLNLVTFQSSTILERRHSHRQWQDLKH